MASTSTKGSSSKGNTRGRSGKSAAAKDNVATAEQDSVATAAESSAALMQEATVRLRQKAAAAAKGREPKPVGKLGRRNLPRRAIAEPEADVCPECEGTGWKILEDGGAGTAVRCDCAHREKGAQYLALAGIPERYRSCQVDNFDTRSSSEASSRQLEKARAICRSYVDNFFDATRNDFRESGLLFVGPPGTGKTHLASAVLAEVVERYRVSGRFVDFTALLQEIQATFDPSTNLSKHSLLNPIIKTRLLVLDELGAQKTSDWLKDTLYYIINTRYTRGLPTLFTTNYRLSYETPRQPARSSSRAGSVGSEGPTPWGDTRAARIQSGEGDTPSRKVENPFTILTERIGPQLESRLYEMAQTVRLDVPDYRRRKTPRHELARR